MIYFRFWRADLDVVPEGGLQPVRSSFPEPFRPSVRPARDCQAVLFGLTPEALGDHVAESTALGYSSRSRTLDGEIFTDGASLFVVTIEEREAEGLHLLAPAGLTLTGTMFPRKTRMVVSYIGFEFDPATVQAVLQALDTTFRITLLETRYSSGEFDKLLKEGMTPPSPPDAMAMRAAHILADKPTRAVAVAIKASGGLLLRDLPKQLPADAGVDTATIRAALEAHNLIESQIVVICKKTQSQVARAPSQEILVKMSDQGVKCACGRAMADELIEEALSITDLGRGLLDGSRWLTLLVVERLQQVGVPLDRLLIEQQVGGDEVDCVADISGDLVLFELKDKDFNLGSAYPFGAKIGIFRPDHAVIFSTHKIGNDAREHFERARLARKPGLTTLLSSTDSSVDILYFEGLEQLWRGIEELSDGVYRRHALLALRPVLALAAIPATALIVALERQGRKEASGNSAAADRVASAHSENSIQSVSA